VLGVSYLEDLGDTRHSPSETLVRILNESWAIVRAHDPYVEYWPELENVPVINDLDEALKDADVVVYAVGHSEYKDHNPEDIVKATKKKPLIIDCSNFLSDDKIEKFLKLGCRVKGVGKGNIERMKR
jgi:UDP-N-acetyl-D-mannosaminuronate dehydrogenase